MKRWIIRIIIAFVFLAILAGVIIYSKRCDSQSCFNFYLGKCDKAEYTSDTKDSIWLYSIKGFSGGKCLVNVGLMSVKEGSSDFKKLEGQEMKCYLDADSVSDPKQDLKKCHGILKEGMQEIIIQRMHSYIIDNVGKISEELEKIE